MTILSVADVVQRAGAVAPQLASSFLTAAVLFLFFYAVVRAPVWLLKFKRWQAYCASHSEFSRQAGEGKYKWLEDPWSSECLPAALFLSRSIDMCQRN